MNSILSNDVEQISNILDEKKFDFLGDFTGNFCKTLNSYAKIPQGFSFKSPKKYQQELTRRLQSDNLSKLSRKEQRHEAHLEDWTRKNNFF